MMNHPIFGAVNFHTGWETNGEIRLFGKVNSIIITAAAYFEKDSITEEQEIAFTTYKSKATTIWRIMEGMLKDYSANAESRFIARELVFERDGGYALLLDDNEDVDGGIAVCMKPDQKIVPQDVYL